MQNGAAGERRDRSFASHASLILTVSLVYFSLTASSSKPKIASAGDAEESTAADRAIATPRASRLEAVACNQDQRG